MSWKVVVGDFVEVIYGSYKGYRGNVMKVDRSSNMVMVSGACMRVKHKKPSDGNPGEVIRSESFIHKSNVMHIMQDGSLSRVGFRFKDYNGKKVKVRFFKKNSEEVKYVR
ncbi:50S ribosomal protein L24 [Candidatus Gromoviella agglomerans]|uniref:50S ribosomal protein L24 n=1 Tax=Candidatus Gromoviella agglomerans TaxID=2806609 RepID=UPI001E624297|nr:50S ribosomal protein L24 [Candidatus Gromoviella agglomerans]UFX98570.1 50S ribosomal protein L24 [Candidatus Gromoviella agglomerans]